MEATHGRNLVLTGFMGTGKTTVGRVLADRLGYSYVDTDDVIESRAGPIAEIFRHEGEYRFRQLERAVAQELATSSRHVISTGGRMMLDEECASCLEPGADVVCLTADADTIVARITTMGKDVRPLLDCADPAGRVRLLMAERANSYGRYPTVDTENRSPEEVAEAVLEALGHDDI